MGGLLRADSCVPVRPLANNEGSNLLQLNRSCTFHPEVGEPESFRDLLRRLVENLDFAQSCCCRQTGYYAVWDRHWKETHDFGDIFPHRSGSLNT